MSVRVPHERLTALILKKGESRSQVKDKLSKNFNEAGLPSGMAKSFSKALIDSMPDSYKREENPMFQRTYWPAFSLTGISFSVITATGIDHFNKVKILSSLSDDWDEWVWEKIKDILLIKYLGSYNKDNAVAFNRTLQCFTTQPVLYSFYLSLLAYDTGAKVTSGEAGLAESWKVMENVITKTLDDLEKLKVDNEIKSYLEDEYLIEHNFEIDVPDILKGNGFKPIERSNIPKFEGYVFIQDYNDLRKIHYNVGKSEAKVIRNYLNRQGFSVESDDFGFNAPSSLEIAKLLRENGITLSRLYNIVRVSLALEEKGLIENIPSLDVINRINQAVGFMNWIKEWVKEDKPEGQAFYSYLSKKTALLSEGKDKIWDKLDKIYGYAHKTEVIPVFRHPLKRLLSSYAQKQAESFNKLTSLSDLKELNKITGINYPTFVSLFNPELSFDEVQSFKEPSFFHANFEL